MKQYWADSFELCKLLLLWYSGEKTWTKCMWKCSGSTTGHRPGTNTCKHWDSSCEEKHQHIFRCEEKCVNVYFVAKKAAVEAVQLLHLNKLINYLIKTPRGSKILMSLIFSWHDISNVPWMTGTVIQPPIHWLFPCYNIEILQPSVVTSGLVSFSSLLIPNVALNRSQHK